jgi:hypothetical protein
MDHYSGEFTFNQVHLKHIQSGIHCMVVNYKKISSTQIAIKKTQQDLQQITFALCLLMMLTLARH